MNMGNKPVNGMNLDVNETGRKFNSKGVSRLHESLCLIFNLTALHSTGIQILSWCG
jgi:hypothetical protein